MNTVVADFKAQLPGECQALEIMAGRRTLLAHVKAEGMMWVVLLTTMPGDCCKAWRMPPGEYWQLQPRYGSRDRFIRENMAPAIKGRANAGKARQTSLF